jgi:hypothetical protein
MSAKTTAIMLASGLAILAATGVSTAARAQTHDIPQSLRIEHEDTVRQLSVIAKRHTQSGAIARKVLALYREHIQREQEFIMPPLTLLPLLAQGKVTPDMAWAVAMADRIKAEQDKIFDEHAAVTDLLNELLAAGEKEHARDVVEFARTAAADSLNDSEILEPTSVVIGEYLRAKLSAGK